MASAVVTVLQGRLQETTITEASTSVLEVHCKKKKIEGGFGNPFSTSLPQKMPLFGRPTELASQLKSCADDYVAAKKFSLGPEPVLARWDKATNECDFGDIDVPAIKDIIRFIWSQTEDKDVGLRAAVIKFAASYHRKYLNTLGSILKDTSAQSKCTPEKYKALFLFQNQFSELDELLESRAPQVWTLARKYEDDLQDLRNFMSTKWP